MAPGIYIHIPFCLKKCHYCAFNSYPPGSGDIRDYMAALEKEMELRGSGQGAGSLYIGGGTPTVVEPVLLASAIAKARDKFGLSPDAELTLEANPGTLEGYGFDVLLEAGVNRVSLGAQSFDDAELGLLGRAHRAADTRKSVNMLRSCGVGNLSIDLMYGLPGQGMDTWEQSIEEAVELGPEHISMYCLSLEEGTPLQRKVRQGGLALPGEGIQAEMYAHAVEHFEKAGYSRYEISNFAAPGFECRHNVNYWRAGDFIGLGAGAYSAVGRRRRINPAGLKEYAVPLLEGREPDAATETVSGEEARREFIMLALRTRDGLDLDEYEKLFGRSFKLEYPDEISRLTDAGCMVLGASYARLTDKGILASNAVISEFF